MEWTNQQISQWQSIKQAYIANVSLVDAFKQKKQFQLQAQQEMLDVLNTFLNDTITLKEFNTIFQRKTHTEWGLFGLRGMSGGLFFNKLVKHIPHEETFTHLLRVMLRLPEDLHSGHRQMVTFTQFFEDLITSQLAERRHLQPARIPFFLSIWWHVQETELWPIFSFDLRHAILLKEIKNFLQDPIETYFLFRARFLGLKQALDFSTWELEDLIQWHYSNVLLGKCPTDSLISYHNMFSISVPLAERKKANCSDTVQIYTNTVSKKGSIVYKKGQRSINHTYIQWLLAKIGQKIGCSVWLSINDHDKVWNGEKLGNLSLSSLSILTNPSNQQIIQHIDVLWLRKNEVIAAFEIEQTTVDVTKNLLRLSDLIITFPKREIQICIVTPQRRSEHIQSELLHPTFQTLGIGSRAKIIIQEYLEQNAEHILRWANNPSILRDLTMYLSVTEQ